MSREVIWQVVNAAENFAGAVKDVENV